MYRLSAIILLFFVTMSCSTTQKIATFKPEPDDASPLIYDNFPSFIDLPITIKLKEIENQTNVFLKGLIYEDNTIEDDDFTIKIWKSAPITLKNINGKIETILPLKVVLNYRYGINKFGVSLYDTREFNLNGKVNLSSNVSLTNWKLNTETELKSIDWNETPTISIAGKSVAITYLINPAIRLFKSKIEKNIDDAIKKTLDFKPNVLDALEKICAPSLINPEYESWLRIVPIELYTTDAKLKKENIELEMGLKCYIETLVGNQPENKFDRNKIVLKPVTSMPNKITANILAVSTYRDASKIMTKNFLGKEFGSASKKVIVQNVNLWHKNGKMVIALDLLGSLNGTIYLSGFPQYNTTTKEIYFDQLDYAIDTKSTLVRTANWLASGFVLKKIQESCRYSIQPNLEEGKQKMQSYIKNFSPMPGVFVNGTIGDIDFKKIQLTNKAIIAFLTIDGKVNILVDGLK
jgi:Domain of unknown function (DUF4403)